MWPKTKRVLQWLWIAPFAALGWLAGCAVRLYTLARTALLTGFEQGKQL